MDRAGVEQWIAAYKEAWKSDDPDQVAALFTEGATYSPFPWPREQNKWQGRDTIVEKWIGHGDSKVGWRFEHEVLAVEGDTAVIEGWTSYDRGEGEPWDEAYANVWLVRFADDGRAREFREWWVQRPGA
jgi:ketosteroid isomerase-like protein